MKKIGIIILVLVALGSAAYFLPKLWELRHDYFFKGDSLELKEETESDNSDDQQSSEDTANDPDFSESEQEEMTTGEEEKDDSELMSVDKRDCDNECQDFNDNEEDLKYCREVCGLRENENGALKGDCESLSGVDKESCYKKKAIESKSYEYCKKIGDEEIRKSCSNRVLEEIINGNNLN